VSLLNIYMSTAVTSTAQAERSRNRFTSAEALVLYIAGAKLLLHLLTATRYGIFRD